MLVNSLPYIWKEQSDICSPPHISGEMLSLPAGCGTGKGVLWDGADQETWDNGAHTPYAPQPSSQLISNLWFQA